MGISKAMMEKVAVGKSRDLDDSTIIVVLGMVTLWQVEVQLFQCL